MKICGKCGTQCDERNLVCSECGTKLSYFVHSSYVTLGGFLLFIVIGNIIIVLNNILSLIFKTDYGELLLAGRSILDLCSIVFSIVFIVCIFKRNHLFMLFDQLIRITGLAAAIYRSCLTISSDTRATIISFAFSFIGFTVGFFLYALYYSRSVRVRTYMGGDDFKRKAIFSFKDKATGNLPA